MPTYLDRLAAIQASQGSANPLPAVDFTRATVRIGDGNGGVPNLSDIVAGGRLVRQVWSGQIVQSVTTNQSNAAQVDILCVIPAIDASGVEIGPFWVTEFIITDELGAPMLAGVTVAPKFTTQEGAAVDLAFIASVGYSEGAVILAAPTAAFVTALQVAQMINAHQPTAQAPVTQTDTLGVDGWLRRVFGLRPARQPSADVAEADATGFGRVATDAEFAAGQAAATAAFKCPWPSLAQIKTAISSVALASGLGVAIGGDKKLNLAYASLPANSSPARGDVLARMIPASGATPPMHVSMTIDQLLSLVAAQAPPSRPVASYTAAGTYTFVAQVEGWFLFECVGAGAGGAGGGGGLTFSGGGGGSGGTSRRWVYLLAGQSVTLAVGQGGGGGPAVDGGAGGPGGSTSAGPYCTATGGRGGECGSTSCAGGVPGAGYGGDINLPGAYGGDGNPINNAVQGGQGAASSLGGGGRTSMTGAGATALAPGSGGGGIWGAGAASVGGRGADGMITVSRAA
jgi:hypothetical protein